MLTLLEGQQEKQILHLTKIVKVLEFLTNDAGLEYMRPRIKVFGSVSQHKIFPVDIDVWVDFSDLDGADTSPDDIEQSSLLLSLARKYYGYFDPFIQVGKYVYTRSDEATKWCKAKNAKAIKTDANNGLPLDQIHEFYEKCLVDMQQ